MVWACANCGTNNKETADKCIVCGTEKPKRAMAPRGRTASSDPVAFVKQPPKSGMALQIDQAQKKYGALFKK